MMSHDEMMNNGTFRSGDHGLHYFSSQMIRDAAAAAARTVFEVCDGKSTPWKGWVHPSGRMVKLAHEVMAKFLDANPNAPAEAVYIHLTNFPCDGERIPMSCGNIWRDEPIAWSEAPASVRAAYETFRHTYLHLWLIARLHNENMARALPPRPQPRLVHSDMMERMQPDDDERLVLSRKVVPFQSALNAPASDGDGAA